MYSSHRRAVGERRCFHTRWMPDRLAPGVQSCLACFQKHGNGRSPLSSPPFQAVLQEKDKFRDYCTALWYIYLRILRGKWYTMLNVMGLSGTPLVPAYVHPWVDPRVPVIPELPQASTESLGYSHCNLDITEEDTKVQKSSWTGFREQSPPCQLL